MLEDERRGGGGALGATRTAVLEEANREGGGALTSNGSMSPLRKEGDEAVASSPLLDPPHSGKGGEEAAAPSPPSDPGCARGLN